MLEELARRVREDGQVRMTARQFLNHFQSHRRGRQVVTRIRNWMDEHQIRTVPDFEGAYIDSTIAVQTEVEATEEVAPQEQLADPTVRIGVLPAANERPIRVSPNDTLTAAVTTMQINGLSRLPVMETDHRVNGMVSWESIGRRQALQHPCEYVLDCMETAREILDIDPFGRYAARYLGAWICARARRGPHNFRHS